MPVDDGEGVHSSSEAHDDRNGVTRTLRELARIFHAREHIDEVLRSLVQAAVLDVPAADYAGITMISPRAISTPVATGPMAEKLDAIQYATGEGPCQSLAPDQQIVKVDDLSQDTRWPEFSALAGELGVRSILSIKLFVEGDSTGSLNLYSGRAAAFDEEAESVGLLLASHAAVAMVGARTEAELRAALTTRDIIGQAKGVLMERYRIDGDDAFALLVKGSQATQRKLREVAEMVALTGEDPDPRQHRRR
jgi:GAF domain-containing protein